MKKLILVIFLILLSTTLQAQVISGPFSGVMGSAAAPSCVVNVNDNCTTGGFFDLTGIGSADSAYINNTGWYLASRFSLSSPSTVTKYYLQIDGIVAAGDFICSLRADVAGEPDTSDIAGTAKTLTISSTGKKEFDLATPKSGQSGALWSYCVGTGGTSSVSSHIGSNSGSKVVYSGGTYDNYIGAVGVCGCTP